MCGQTNNNRFGQKSTIVETRETIVGYYILTRLHSQITKFVRHQQQNERKDEMSCTQILRKAEIKVAAMRPHNILLLSHTKITSRLFLLSLLLLLTGLVVARRLLCFGEPTI